MGGSSRCGNACAGSIQCDAQDKEGVRAGRYGQDQAETGEGCEGSKSHKHDYQPLGSTGKAFTSRQGLFVQRQGRVA